MDEVQKIAAQVEGLRLIDASDGLHDRQSLEAIKVKDMLDIPGQDEQLPQPSLSVEPERTRRTGKCNLRKSLAWDSAFFTSEGVLEPEELSTMIEGAERGGKHMLPGIQEDDVHRSMDSISTFESDNLTLESIEADLFQDIRASIQKSSKSSSEANSSSKAGLVEKEAQTINSARKVDLASQNKLNSKLPSKKPSIGMQGSGKIMKQSSVRQQVTQAIRRSGESTSSLHKLPKALGIVKPMPAASTKRASLGLNRLKMDTNNAKSPTVAGRGAPSSKVHGLGDSRSIVPRPMPSSKSSSMGSSTTVKTELRTSCSSFDSSGSTSSDNISKSPLKSMKRNVGPRTINRLSSGSVKTPSKIASRIKLQSGNPGLSTNFTLTPKLSPNISPASSVSEWSSESSSSTSAVNNSKSSRSSPRGSDIQNHSSDQFSMGHENQVKGTPSQAVNGVLSGTGTISRPASAKPSGLRMPSPKIGFFDGVKSMVRSPKRNMHSYSGAPSGLPKTGAPPKTSPSGESNKSKLGKVQSTSIATPTQQTGMSSKPTFHTPLQKPLNASGKVTTALRTVRNSFGSSPKTGGDELKTEEKLDAKGAGGLPKISVAKRSPSSGDSNKSKLGKIQPASTVTPIQQPLRKSLNASPKGSGVSRALRISPKSQNGMSPGENQLKTEEVGEYDPDSCLKNMKCSEVNINGNIKSSQEVGEGKAHIHIQANGFGESDVNCLGNLNSPESLRNVAKPTPSSCSSITSEIIDNAKEESCSSILLKPVLLSSSPITSETIIDSQNEVAKPSLASPSSITSEVIDSPRIPFSIKNSFGNADGLSDLTVEVVVVDKTPNTSFPVLENGQKENS